MNRGLHGGYLASNFCKAITIGKKILNSHIDMGKNCQGCKEHNPNSE